MAEGGAADEAEADRRPDSWGKWLRARYLPLVLLAALFMVALACFYEPFLELIGMARWQEGTRATLGVPWITWVGYPTLAVLFLLAWSWAWRYASGLGNGGPRPARLLGALAMTLVPLALAHAAGLQAIKNLLGW